MIHFDWCLLLKVKWTLMVSTGWYNVIWRCLNDCLVFTSRLMCVYCLYFASLYIVAASVWIPAAWDNSFILIVLERKLIVLNSWCTLMMCNGWVPCGHESISVIWEGQRWTLIDRCVSGKMAQHLVQGIQSADSIHVITLLMSALFTVNTMWTN